MSKHLPREERGDKVTPSSKRRKIGGGSVAAGVAAAEAFARELLQGLPPVAKRRRRRGRRIDDESCDTTDADEDPGKLVKEATSQYNLIRALDHQLVLCGVGGLQTFIADENRTRLLRPTEHRYEAKDLEAFEGHEAKVWQRFVVKDEVTGKKRWEVPIPPAGDRSRPLIVPFTDECAYQIGALQGLIHGVNLRCWAFRDPFHRRWNDVTDALKKAGLWSDVLERMHCENLTIGPWKSCRWWREMQQTMQQHFEIAGKENPLFRLLGPKLEQEARNAGRIVGEPGSVEAEEAAYKWVKKVAELKRHNRLYKTKTWFKPLEAMAKGRKKHYAYLYILCILCQSQGHMKKLADMPVHGDGLPNALVRVLPYSGGALPPASPESPYEERIQSLRGRCQNACVVACHLQGEPGARTRSDIILAIVEPTWSGFVQEVRRLKKPDDIRKRYVHMARRGGEIESIRIYTMMRNRRFLKRCFTRDDPRSLPPDCYKSYKDALCRLYQGGGGIKFKRRACARIACVRGLGILRPTCGRNGAGAFGLEFHETTFRQ